MSNIVDVTFNFEYFEDLALNSVKNFNNAVDKASEAKELWESALKFENIENVEPWLQTFYKNVIHDDGSMYQQSYNRTKEMVKAIVIEVLSDLKLKTKKLKSIFSVLIESMRSRVLYLEDKYSQDELYGNYKLRTEKQDLNRKIKKCN